MRGDRPQPPSRADGNEPKFSLDSGGEKVEKGGNRAEDRGRKRKETRAGFVSFFIKGNLVFGHARDEPVEGEARE